MRLFWRRIINWFSRPRDRNLEKMRARAAAALRREDKEVERRKKH